MVYDNTLGTPIFTGQSGYAIHECPAELSTGTPIMYEIYTDDGRGNGDYVCTSSQLYWARRIAHGLDNLEAENFDLQGNYL